MELGRRGIRQSIMWTCAFSVCEGYLPFCTETAYRPVKCSFCTSLLRYSYIPRTFTASSISLRVILPGNYFHLAEPNTDIKRVFNYSSSCILSAILWHSNEANKAEIFQFSYERVMNLQKHEIIINKYVYKKINLKYNK